MATTPIKEVSSVLNLQAAMGNMAAGAAGASKNAEDSFQSVFNNQTGAGKADAAKAQATKRSDNKAKPGEDLRAKEHARRNMKTNDAKQKDQLSDEDLERASEAVSAAAEDLTKQIADTFGLTAEELQELMADMDIQPEDLLNPQILSNLLLQVSGAQDSMALLTNEELYGDYQMLMEQARKMTEALSEELAAVTEPVNVVMDAAELAEDEQQNLLDDGENEEEQNSVMPDHAVQVQTEEKPGEAQMKAGAKQEGGSEHGAAKHGRSEMRQEGEGNLVLQTIKNENFEYQMEAVQTTAGGSEVDTQNIMRQIMDYMRVQIRPDETSMEMQLHPASLGTLQIQIAAKGGVLTANFITQNEAVKAALESQMVQLQENFEQQGIKVEAIEVTVATHQFEQNLDQQGREGEQSGEAQEARRPRVRRINLGGSDEMLSPEEMEALEDEDRIAAEMMAANGGTVDYTA
ncbi:MAG: flagellar hook-length control protein FliK [Lachnospiraceae bacterium]|nr:flagellar hook-length control protein FliK [Lachnospiraceae bacterium]